MILSRDPKEKAKWSVDGQKKREKEVRAFVKDLNIQITNLCQFLSQDKVVFRVNIY